MHNKVDKKSVNLFQFPHKMFRQMWFSTIQKCGTLDPLDKSDREDFSRNLIMSSNIYKEHNNHENKEIMPFVEKITKDSSYEWAKDHLKHIETLDKFIELANKLLTCPENELKALKKEIYEKLCVFLSEDLHHMNWEETVINKILLDNFELEELMEIHQKIVKSFEPQRIPKMLPLILSSVDVYEVANFLKPIQGFSESHPTIWEECCGIIKKQLSPNNFEKLNTMIPIS